MIGHFSRRVRVTGNTKCSWPVVLDVLFVLLAVFVFFCGQYMNQTSPHRVTERIGTTILSDRMVTNRFEKQITTSFVAKENGFGIKSVTVTNELWHVWRIFQ
jgi:phage gp37-like protein